MSFKYFCSVLTVGIVSVSLHCGAVSLDLARFKGKAEVELAKLVGQKNMTTAAGKIYFVDGASSIELEPIFDEAAFLYVVQIKDGVLPVPNLLLAYKLDLAGGEGPVFAQVSANEGNFLYASAEVGMILLKEGVAEDIGNQLLKKLVTASPQGQFEYIKELFAIRYEMPVSELKNVFPILRLHPDVQEIEPSFENYREPFAFQPALPLPDSGVVDADQYRDLTKRLKAQGLKFLTETTVPADLQGPK